MKRINIVCITLLMILLGVNTSCADYLDKAPDEDLTLDDVFTRENYADQFLIQIVLPTSLIMGPGHLIMF